MSDRCPLGYLFCCSFLEAWCSVCSSENSVYVGIPAQVFAVVHARPDLTEWHG